MERMAGRGFQQHEHPLDHEALRVVRPDPDVSPAKEVSTPSQR